MGEADPKATAAVYPPSSILGSRMAIDHDGPLPTPHELGLADAKRCALEWQTQRSYAKLNDIHGTLSGKPGARWVLETHAILGVIAEQILVAVELEVEKEVVRRAIVALSTSSHESKTSILAHYSRSLRFFAEGQANAIVVALHGLANMVARTLEFERDLTSAELKTLRMSRPDFVPGSAAREAWLSWTASTVSSLRTMAAVRGTDVQAAVRVLDRLSQQTAIVDLLELRNTQYHRWRGESAGVTGIAHGEPPVAAILAAGQSVSFGREILPPYTAGQANLDEIVRASRDALNAFVANMDDFLTTWRATIPHQSL